MTKKVVAFIPIKLNSQRLPHKNILPILDKPLCWHITNTLVNVDRIDEVYVYCSSDEILDYIPQEAKYLKRDQLLDGDLVKGFDIYESFIKKIDADIYILAHTTSPFIEQQTIENSLNKILKDDYDSAFTAQKIQTFAWHKGETINYNINDVPRTQDIEPIYIETSGFFMFKKEVFTNHRRRIGFAPFIQEVNNIEAIDIDTKEDYEYAKRIIENRIEEGDYKTCLL